MIRVGYFMDTLPAIGGVERCVEQMLLALPESEYQVCLISNQKLIHEFLLKTRRLDFVCIKDDSREKVQDRNKTRVFRKWIWRLRSSTSKESEILASSVDFFERLFLHAFDQYPLDILHLHAGGFPRYSTALLALDRLRRSGEFVPKIILTVHHPVQISPRTLPVFLEWDRRAWNVPDIKVSVSEHSRRSVAALVPDGPSEMLLIHNGISRPPSVFSDNQIQDERARLGLLEETVVLSVATRMVSHKQVPLLVDMIHKVLDKFPMVEFILVGEGEDLPIVNERILASCHSDRMHALGYVDDIFLTLSASDVFVFASRDEGFGLVLGEAMLLNKPCVAFDIGGVNEVVEHGKTGFLAELGDVEQFVGYVCRLVNDSDLRNEMGIAGRERVEALFSLERMQEAHIELYQKAIA